MNTFADAATARACYGACWCWNSGTGISWRRDRTGASRARRPTYSPAKPEGSSLRRPPCRHSHEREEQRVPSIDRRACADDSRACQPCRVTRSYGLEPGARICAGLRALGNDSALPHAAFGRKLCGVPGRVQCIQPAGTAIWGPVRLRPTRRSCWRRGTRAGCSLNPVWTSKKSRRK